MKKFKLVLLLCACVLGLTACGQTEEKVLDAEEAAQLESNTQNIITQCLAQFSSDQAEEFASMGSEYMEYVFSNYFGMQVEGNAIVGGMESWSSALEEMGPFVNVTGMSAEYDDQGSDIVVTVEIAGEKRTAEVEAIYEDDMYHTLSSLTTNVDYTLGEKMGKAGLNTLMGMGTVFIVLILIAWIIGLFKYIPVIQAKFSKKDKAAEAPAKEDRAVAQIVAAEEEQTDNLELIAVITAAIAASEGGSADDYVVRSIRRKANSQWNKVY